MEVTNEVRAGWAKDAIISFQDRTGTDDVDAMSDLLCDLMHLADQDGLDFNAELARATFHYDSEIEVEKADKHQTDTWDTSKPYPDEPGFKEES